MNLWAIIQVNIESPLSPSLREKSSQQIFNGLLPCANFSIPKGKTCIQRVSHKKGSRNIMVRQ